MASLSSEKLAQAEALSKRALEQNDPWSAFVALGLDPALLNDKSQAQSIQDFPHLTLVALSGFVHHSIENRGPDSRPDWGIAFMHACDNLVYDHDCWQTLAAPFAAEIANWTHYQPDLSIALWMKSAVNEAVKDMSDASLFEEGEANTLKLFADALFDNSAPQNEALFTELVGQGIMADMPSNGQHANNALIYARVGQIENQGVTQHIASQLLLKINNGSAIDWITVLRSACSNTPGSEPMSIAYENAFRSESGHQDEGYLFALLEASLSRMKFGSFNKDYHIEMIQKAIMSDDIDRSKLASHITTQSHLALIEKDLNLNFNYIFDKGDLSGRGLAALLQESLGL